MIDRLATLERAQRIGRQCGDRRGGPRRLLAPPLPSARKFGLASSVTSASALDANSTRLHVELRREQRHELLQIASTASPCRGSTHTIRASGWRTFTPADSARRAAERGERADLAHRLLELRLRRRTAPAARTARRAPDSPVSSRCIQSVTNGANGASSRQLATSTSCSVANAARLSGAVDAVEPLARAAHVPLRDVVVHELHHDARGARRVEAVEQAVRRCLDRREAREHPAVERRPSLARRDPRGDGAHPKFAYSANMPLYMFLSVTQEAARGPADRPPRRSCAASTPGSPRRGTAGRRRRRAAPSPPSDPPRCRGSSTSSARSRRARGRSRPRCRYGAGDAAPDAAARRSQRVAEPGRDREQRVEPAARLVHALGDEIGRELPPEQLARSRTDSATARTASSPSRTRRRSPRGARRIVPVPRLRTATCTRR